MQKPTGSQAITDDWPSSQGPYRRLASIAVLDVVGYSGLMDADEVGTHARWSEMCARLIAPSVSKNRGEIVKSTGDGFLVEFQSAVDSVRWALDLQTSIASPAAGGSALRLRIAVHIGNIIPEQNDIFGSDVNIASRMQEFAEPGGVLVSAAVHEQVRNVLDYAAEDCGLIALKNIRRPIHAFNIFPLGQRPAVSAISRPQVHQPSIAVLPPRVLGGETMDSYFTEGMVHELVASLSGLRELFVISSSSTVALSGVTTDKTRIGRGLGVRYLLTGAIARAAERLRLFFELSDVLTSEVIWSGRYDIEQNELFTTQDVIASKIAYSLIPHLRQSELQRALRKPPGDMDAYALVLQALHRLHRFREGDLEAAHHLLDQAVARETRYAAAYAWQAVLLLIRVGEGYSTSRHADAAEAQRLALLALEQDPSHPIALAIYGHCMSFLFGQCDRALESFNRAIASSPSSALAWSLSAPTFVYLGRPTEAIRRAERGLMLSPLDPLATWSYGTLSLAHYFNGTYEESIRWGRQVLSIGFTDALVFRPMIASFVAAGRIEEAREAARTYVGRAPNFSIGSFLERYPLQDSAALAQYGERLLAAGLPP